MKKGKRKNLWQKRLDRKFESAHYKRLNGVGSGPSRNTRHALTATAKTASNQLADRGIATASEIGVYSPEGQWLIEGHGVDPDIVVDNLPHATFNGHDAQLEAAIKHLEELIKKNPRPAPKAPNYPDKSLKY